METNKGATDKERKKLINENFGEKKINNNNNNNNNRLHIK